MAIPRPQSRQPIPKTAERVFKGQLFDVYQWQQTLYDGSVATFEKLRRPDTAYVIPVTSGGTLTIAEQRQPGSSVAVLGLLGGRIDDPETPEQAAARELLEEAGMQAGSLFLWDSYQFLPKLDWAIYTFIARDCHVVRPQSLDAGEAIQLRQVSFDELLALAAQDRFGDLEVALRLLRIAADPERLAQARKLFFV
jgi:8-oxo-dGTP pyrophosphatase MutT (NUDIX family)